MKNKPVVILVEGNKTEMNALVSKVEGGGYRVIPAYKGQEAIVSVSSYCPDLIVLGLELPDMSGIEVIKSIRSWSTSPIIALSENRSEDAVVSALDSGADSVMVKPFGEKLLMGQIRAAVRRGIINKVDDVCMMRTFGGGKLSIDYEKRRVMVSGSEVHLTPIEYKILVTISSAPGRAMTYAAIRREVWGPYAGDNKTLRVNVANLRKKIERNPAFSEYIFTVVGVGYRMADEDAEFKTGND